MSRVGCGWYAPIKSSANPTRQAPQQPTRGKRLQAILQSCSSSNAALKALDAGNAVVPAAAAGPAPAEMAAAGAPPDHSQGATMQSMVERLAERLKLSGSDPEGWLTLVRSYVTLGEKDKATAAISDARRALTDDPDKLEQFNKALKNFNIGG